MYQEKRNQSENSVEIKIKVEELKILKELKVPAKWLKIFSAIFYAFCSLLFTIINKIVLTSYGFPSFPLLALAHLLSTCLILKILKEGRVIHYPNISRHSFKKIFPLPILFLGNVLTCLGGVKELSLPMFTALRRFAILITMILEFYILDIKPTLWVHLGVYLMIGGSLIAALSDVTFHLEGYSMIMANNLFVAASRVCTKKKLEGEEFGRFGLMYYNALLMILPLTIFVYFTEGFEQAWHYTQWRSGSFQLNFGLSCILAYLVHFAIVLCTHTNSALTTATVGCFKDIVVTHVGMLVGGDYVYNFYNAVGLNLGAVGSFFYIYVTFCTPSDLKFLTRFLIPLRLLRKKYGAGFKI